MKKVFIFVVSLLLTGCSGGCNKAKDMVGLGPTQEEVAAQKEREQQQLKEGDALVARWAEKVEGNATGNGFKRTEGLTEADPWGHQVKIEYTQDWFKEVATIRSAGPDGSFNTGDDLVRTRTASNPMGVFSGLPGWVWFVIIWGCCGTLAFMFSSGVAHRRAAKGKNKHHRHPAAFVIATIVLAPLALLLYGLQFIGGALGASGDFFDGFEFDFDVDIDL